MACGNIKGVKENVMRKCHNSILRKTINAHTVFVFELFYDKYLGHYTEKNFGLRIQEAAEGIGKIFKVEYIIK